MGVGWPAPTAAACSGKACADLEPATGDAAGWRLSVACPSRSPATPSASHHPSVTLTPSTHVTAVLRVSVSFFPLAPAASFHVLPVSDRLQTASTARCPLGPLYPKTYKNACPPTFPSTAARSPAPSLALTPAPPPAALHAAAAGPLALPDARPVDLACRALTCAFDCGPPRP